MLPPPRCICWFPEGRKESGVHVGPGFTPVSGKNSRGNGPHSCLRWPRLGFSSHFLQPIYLSLQKTSASPLGLSIYLSKYRAPLKFQPYLRGKNAIQHVDAKERRDRPGAVERAGLYPGNPLCMYVCSWVKRRPCSAAWGWPRHPAFAFRGSPGRVSPGGPFQACFDLLGRSKQA